MRKIYVIIVFLLLFIIYPNNVLAWRGAYNYEVTDFEIVNNQATLEGWAILNARNGYQNNGRGTGSVLTGDKNRQSGKYSIIYSTYSDQNANVFKNGYCNYGSMVYYSNSGTRISEEFDSGYTYKYQLELYKVDNNNRETKVDINIKYNNLKTSLTYAQAYKTGSTAIFEDKMGGKRFTACYENVGFQFTFDTTNLINSGNIKGYRLYLTVKTGDKSGCKVDCSARFPLEVISGNFDDSDLYFKGTAEKVKILVTGGKSWKEPSIASTSKTYNSLDYYSTEYWVQDIVYNTADGHSWYQISKSKNGTSLGWVPASWINPVGGITYLNPSDEEVEVCDESQVVQTNQTKEAVCNGETSFSGDDSQSCSVISSENDYYKITCTENLNTKLIPSNVGTIQLGLGFSYDIKVSTKRKCTGVFDYEAFNDAYTKVLNNLNNSQNGSALYNTNLNKKNELERILKNYNAWESSDYDLNSIKATLHDEQLGTTVNFITKPNSMTETIGDKKITKTHNLNIRGIANPTDFTYEEELAKTLILPSAYYNLSNNTVVYNNCANCVLLSNQYYISGNQRYDGTNYKYKVSVSNLGYNRSWNVVTNNCSLKVENDISIYRPTDIADPFLNEANNNRETGRNWLNDTFDFTGIIKDDIWSKKSLYEFNITTKNVKNIRFSNSELGANAYIGTDCFLNAAKNKYFCEFLRNSQYFQYHYIYSDELQ